MTTSTFLGREPAAVSAVISLGLKALLLFNVIQWSPEQELGLMAFLDATLFLIVRQNVTPTASPRLPLGTPVLVEGTDDQPPADAAVLTVGPRSPRNREV